MKKLTIILIAFFTYSAASGQIAFRGGLNYSNVSVEGTNVDFGSDSKIGYHLGFQGHIALGGLNLRPALLYHVKGGKAADNGSLGNTNLHYIEVPVNLALKLGGESLAIIIEAGPYFGYLVNTSSGFVDNLDNRLNKSDWGINFGGVVEIRGLGIGVNYSNSLSSIAREDQFGQAFTTKNGNLSLFGYLKF